MAFTTTPTPERALLVTLVERYLAGFMDPHVSLLEIHSLMYLAHHAGEPLSVQYVKGPDRPNADDLRHILAMTHGALSSANVDALDGPLELMPGAVDDARAILRQHPQAQSRHERVAKLIEGFETAFGMALLTTVHAVATREGAAGHALTRAAHAWGSPTRAFSERQIQLAARRLIDARWLPDPGTAPASDLPNAEDLR